MVVSSTSSPSMTLSLLAVNIDDLYKGLIVISFPTKSISRRFGNPPRIKQKSSRY